MDELEKFNLNYEIIQDTLLRLYDEKRETEMKIAHIHEPLETNKKRAAKIGYKWDPEAEEWIK